MHELATANKILDAQITDAEFKRGIERNKILHDCKTKGFKNLQSMGHLSGGIRLSKMEPAAPEHTPLEFAQKGSQMVQEGKSISQAAAAFGRNAGDLKYYCNKFGIHYESKFKKKQWDYDATYRRIRRFMNERGYNIKDTALKIKGSTPLVTNILASKGRFYNVKTKKIERIK